jgi:hypothetical protein
VANRVTIITDRNLIFLVFIADRFCFTAGSINSGPKHELV